MHASDGLNRLGTSKVYRGGTAGSCAQGPTAGAVMGLTYDLVGNIGMRTNTGITVGTGTQNDTYAYSDPNHPYAVTSVTSISGTYAYDANGNMTSGNGRSITWNDDNLPTYIASTGTVNGNNTVTGSSTFSYGPDLQRYQQVTTDSVAGNSTTTYVGGLFEIVASSGGTQYRHNIMAAGGVVAVHTLDQTGNATTNYLHSDNLGSSDTITGDTGAVVQQTSFDAFGLRRDTTNWAYDLTGTQISSLKGKTDRGFTFQEQLDSVGLVHMNGRVYDPGIGRFISADPKIQDLGNSQSFNRYQYVFGNPLAYTDPTGFDGCAGTISVPTAADGGGASPCGSFDNPIGDDNDYGCGRDGEPPCQLGKVTARASCGGLCAQIANAAAALVNAWLDSLQAPGSQNETPDNNTDKSKDKNKSNNNNKDNCPPDNSSSVSNILPHSFGVTAGASAEAGVGNTGAAVTGSLGAGVFFDSKGNATSGTFATAGAAAYDVQSSTSAAAPSSTPIVGGGSTSAGVLGFISNAQNVGQLAGAFTTSSFNAGEGPAQISVQLSRGTDANGNFIYQASVSPPGLGVTQGVSVSQITTNTVVNSSSGGNGQTSGGCSHH